MFASVNSERRSSHLLRRFSGEDTAHMIIYIDEITYVHTTHICICTFFFQIYVGVETMIFIENELYRASYRVVCFEISRIPIYLLRFRKNDILT